MFCNVLDLSTLEHWVMYCYVNIGQRIYLPTFSCVDCCLEHKYHVIGFLKQQSKITP